MRQKAFTTLIIVLFRIVKNLSIDFFRF